MMDNILSKEQINFLNSSGYIIVDDFFTNNELETFKETLRLIIQYQIRKATNNNMNTDNIVIGEEFSNGMLELEKFDHDYIADISDYLLSIPETFLLLSKPELKFIINQLLQIDLNSPLYITNTGIIVSMPNDEDHTYGWHKEYFTTIPDSKFFQIWSPMVDNATADLGTIMVCPGSHLATWKGQIRVQNNRQSKSYQITKEELEKYDKVSIELELGQLVIMSPGLIHRSGNNKSNNCRFSLVGIYHQIENNGIRPWVPTYNYKGKTNIEYYNELYDDQ